VCVGQNPIQGLTVDDQTALWVLGEHLNGQWVLGPGRRGGRVPAECIFVLCIELQGRDKPGKYIATAFDRDRELGYLVACQGGGDQ
jgi:hypothetical protein